MKAPFDIHNIIHVVIDCPSCPSFSVELLPSAVQPGKGRLAVEGICECNVKLSGIIEIKHVKVARPE